MAVDAGGGSAVVVSAGAVKKKNETKNTSWVGVDALDQKSRCLRHRAELGVLVVMTMSSSLTAADGSAVIRQSSS